MTMSRRRWFTAGVAIGAAFVLDDAVPINDVQREKWMAWLNDNLDPATMLKEHMLEFYAYETYGGIVSFSETPIEELAAIPFA